MDSSESNDLENEELVAATERIFRTEIAERVAKQQCLQCGTPLSEAYQFDGYTLCRFCGRVEAKSGR